MLESYLMEIIAGVSLLVVIAIYVIIKKSKKTEITQIDTFDTKDVTYDSFEPAKAKRKPKEYLDDFIKQKYNEEKAKQKEDSQFLNSVEERSFEVVEEP